MSSSKPAFPLLSLPDLILTAVLNCLEGNDRHSLASSYRALATLVSAAWGNTWASVTSETSWKGLCKVLSTNLINCKALELVGNVANDDADVPVEDSALSFLLDPHNKPAPGCLFAGVEKVLIEKAQPLPCLLPPNIASVMPDIKDLFIENTSMQYANPQPIPYCSTLCKITYWGRFDPGLPIKYHTAEDLRRQLPNISSLVLFQCVWAKYSNTATDNFINTMLQAWGDQLTELCLDTDVNLEHCTRLQSLTWIAEHFHPTLDCLPTSLTRLKLQFSIKEADLSTILRLPLLRVVDVSGFNSLQHDWSKHPCTWQQLTVHQINIVQLPKLPLHSLTGDSCLKIHVLLLPDPLLPGSLEDVARAARCVSRAGITINDCHGCGYLCDTTTEGPADRKKDLQLVELVHIASGVAKPSKQFSIWFNELLRYPQTATARIKWLSSSICCGANASTN